MRRLIALAASLSLAAAPAFGQGAAAGLTRIGAAAAVHGAVQAQAPGAVGRVISSGKPLFLNDHVTTDAAGRLQVLLLDETVFTLGPNADMVLDEFVYDPSTDAGKVTARMTKGVFRFVTGKVARKDPSSMKIKLPVGTIGIRGTIAIAEAKGNESTAILLGPGSQTNTDEAPGAITFENNGTMRVIGKPGSGVTCQAGQAPSSVQDMTSRAADLNAQLETPRDQRAQNQGGPASGGTATSQSGQAVASARHDSTQALDDTETAGDNTQLITQVNQTNAVADGPSTWEALRSNVTTGQGYYFSGEAPITCSGCLSTAAEGSLQLQIDFGARTVGGTGLNNPVSGSNQSFIHIHGVASSGNTDTIQQTISQMSFASLTGPSVITLNSSNLGSTTNTAGGTGNFNNSTIAIQNANGVTAANALTNFRFSGTNTSSNPVSASGSFTSPRY